LRVEREQVRHARELLEKSTGVASARAINVSV